MAKEQDGSTIPEVHNLSEKTGQCSLCEKASGSLMCGQCYFDRFKAELGIQKENPGINNESRTLDTFLSASIDGVEVIEAARRAAGIA